MVTKRDIEVIERIVRGMSEAKHWGLVYWLGDGCHRSLWDYCKPYRYRKPNASDRAGTAQAVDHRGT
jgi:hypothetical protein